MNKNLKNLCIAYNYEKSKMAYFFTKGDIVNAGKSYLRSKKEDIEGYKFYSLYKLLNKEYTDLKSMLKDFYNDKNYLSFRTMFLLNNNKTIVDIINDIIDEELTYPERILRCVYNEHPELEKGWGTFIKGE